MNFFPDIFFAVAQVYYLKQEKNMAKLSSITSENRDNEADYLLRSSFARSMPFSIGINICKSSPLVYRIEWKKMHLPDTSSCLVIKNIKIKFYPYSIHIFRICFLLNQDYCSNKILSISKIQLIFPFIVLV